MAERHRADRASLGLAVVYLAPLAVLVLRAAADVWRAPAVWPQQLGSRGWSALAAPQVLTAAGGSLLVAVVTTGVALPLAWGAARTIASRDTAARRWLLLAIALPLLVPPYAAGVGLGAWFARWGLLDSHVALVLAHLVFVLPYVVIVLATGLGRRVDELEEAAAVLGARWSQRLRLVLVPAVCRPVAVACLLGFVVSWSQYGTSLAVGGGVPMLPLVLVPFVGADPQTASALAVAFLVPPLLALAVVAVAARDR